MIERIEQQYKREDIVEAKMNYYKNLQPYAGNFKMSQMNPTQQILQESHEKNKKFMDDHRLLFGQNK